MAIEGRCMKCGEQKPMKDEEIIEMKGKGGTKRRAAKGVCPDCGTKMYKFLPSK